MRRVRELRGNGRKQKSRSGPHEMKKEKKKRQAKKKARRLKRETGDYWQAQEIREEVRRCTRKKCVVLRMRKWVVTVRTREKREA
jgi:hypothetical protein